MRNLSSKGAGDPNLGPHAYRTGILPTVLSPQSRPTVLDHFYHPESPINLVVSVFKVLPSECFL